MKTAIVAIATLVLGASAASAQSTQGGAASDPAVTEKVLPKAIGAPSLPQSSPHAGHTRDPAATQPTHKHPATATGVDTTAGAMSRPSSVTSSPSMSGGAAATVTADEAERDAEAVGARPAAKP